MAVRPKTQPVTIFGITSCDTMKTARAWLDAHDVAFVFHDYKVAGISKVKLETWVRAVGWETLLNRAGTTFRGPADANKQAITPAKAIKLMLANPAMIKRPVLEANGQLLVGFKPDQYEATLRRFRVLPEKCEAVFR